MISQLAEEIYEKAIQLKKYNSNNLLLKQNRIILGKEIYALEEITKKLLLELRNNPNYSNADFELALFMNTSLTECLLFLITKNRNYRKTVQRYIWGFHNLPRAFLSSKNPMKTSPEQALEYYKPYLKMD